MRNTSFNDMTDMTREEAMRRFMLAKQRKAEILAKLEKEMKEEYEKTTGLKANYFFAM